MLPKTLFRFLYVLSADGIASGHAYNCGTQKPEHCRIFTGLWNVVIFGRSTVLCGLCRSCGLCGLLGSCRSCFCGSSGSGSGGAVILCFGLQGSVFNGQLTCGETVGLIENALVTVVFGNQMIDGTDTVDGGMQIIGFIMPIISRVSTLLLKFALASPYT